MSNKPTQRDKQIITVAVAFAFGLGAFMFPTVTNSFVPSAYALDWHPAHLNVNLHQLLAQINQCVDQGTAVFQLWKQPSKYSFAPRLVQPC